MNVDSRMTCVTGCFPQHHLAQEFRAQTCQPPISEYVLSATTSLNIILADGKSQLSNHRDFPRAVHGTFVTALINTPVPLYNKVPRGRVWWTEDSHVTLKFRQAPYLTVAKAFEYRYRRKEVI